MLDTLLERKESRVEENKSSHPAGGAQTGSARVYPVMVHTNQSGCPLGAQAADTSMNL